MIWLVYFLEAPERSGAEPEQSGAGACNPVTMMVFLHNIISEEFGQERTILNWLGVQGGLKRAYSEGHTTLGLRLF
jgi:hypothetical protein